MQPKSIDLSWITVSDFQKAVDFFTHVIGLQVKERNDQYGWAELGTEAGGALLGIAGASDEGSFRPGHNAIVTITVDDIEKESQALREKNVKILGEIMEVPGHVKLLLFTDPDGNHFQLVQTLQ